jgi:deoxyadenosine/deoxycytidine kinase
MAGVVVAMCAPTRSGKTHLVKKLAEYYSAPVVLETDSGIFPDRINEDIATGSRPLERDLYFRNRQLQMLLRARELALDHDLVLIDALWACTEFYIDMYQIDPFERSLMKELAELDIKTLPWPDVLVVIRADDATSERLWRASGQVFERGEKYFESQVLGIKHAFEAWLDQVTFPIPSIEIERSHLDFDMPDDLRIVIERLRPHIRTL